MLSSCKFCRSLAALMAVILAGRVGAENAGMISGTLRLKGAPPAIHQVQPAHGGDVCVETARPLQVLTLGANQTVANAIVYLGTRPTNSATGSVLTLELRNCEFVPRIQVARTVAAVVLKNSDPVLHVVRLDLLSGTNAPRTLATIAAPYAGFAQQIPLPPIKEPVLLKAVGLNGHEWLTGYIAILPQPHATLSDAGGHFKLGPVRPGIYKLYAWHEALGTLASEITVTADTAVNTELTFTTIDPKQAD